MIISESKLRRLIREVLEETDLPKVDPPTYKKIIERTVSDFFNPGLDITSTNDLDTRGKYELADDFLYRIRGADLVNEVEALHEMIKVISENKLNLSDPDMKYSVKNANDSRRLEALKNLNEDDMLSVEKSLKFLFSDLYLEYFDRYDLGEEGRVKKVREGNSILAERSRILNTLPKNILNNLANENLWGDSRYMKEITNIAILFLKELKEYKS
tara:strand:- start:85 stop:726 length:642 start_codon:yes stop_codon:yes gene_type:complete